MRSVYLAILVTLLSATPAAANDVITLGEVLPALADTELGAIEVGDAPPPGSVRSVRRSEIIAALRRAGRSSAGLAIPRYVRISRESRELSRSEASSLALPAVTEALSPCQVDDLRVPHDVSVSTGPLHVTAEAEVPHRSRSVGVVVQFHSRGREVRVPVRARVTCPPPALEAGDQVQLRVRVGNVIATAPGEARQPGRIGEIIRVTNTATRTSLEGRVLSSDRVEVVQ